MRGVAYALIFAACVFASGCGDDPVYVYWDWQCTAFCSDGSSGPITADNTSEYLCEDRDANGDDVLNTLGLACDQVVAGDPCYGTCASCKVRAGSKKCTP